MKKEQDRWSGSSDPDGIVDALMTDPKRARAVRKLLKDRLSTPVVGQRHVPPVADFENDTDDLWDNVPV